VKRLAERTLRSRLLRIYAVCLLSCVTVIQSARANWSRPAEDEAETIVQVAIAIPPKPEGAGELAEGEGEKSLYNEAACRKLNGDFRDVCFHTVARRRAERDLSGARLACDEIERERLKFECMADIAEMHVWTDLESARSVCPEIPRKKWHDQCFFGIAMALSHRLPDDALEACNEAGIWRDFCRHDVIGEVSARDVDWALGICGRETGDPLTRKTCWHGIGKYVGRVDVDAGFSACTRVPPGPDNLYVENCIHGVGWAISEQLGASGAPTCASAGANKDSCYLGIAFNLKRLDPESANAICQQVTRDDLQAHCLAFLSR